MTEYAPTSHAIRVADLAASKVKAFEITPETAELETIKTTLDLLGLRKVRMTGEISPLGKRDWKLTAQLGATVVQPCVATLDPVTTRIETDVVRQFLSDFEAPDTPEAEMPDDDTSEALGSFIDPGLVLIEALSLALPLYPRLDGVDDTPYVQTKPSQTPMQDEDARPFAALTALKEQMEDGGS